MSPNREKQVLELKLAMTAEAAVRKWGEIPQQVKAIEEMGELLVNLAKRINGVPITNEDIIDEIGDVTIMLAQLRRIYGNTRIDARVDQKLDLIKSAIERGWDAVYTERNGIPTGM